MSSRGEALRWWASLNEARRVEVISRHVPAHLQHLARVFPTGRTIEQVYEKEVTT